MSDSFGKKFYADYQFWALLVSAISLVVMGLFALLAFNIQSTLKAMETAQKKSHYANQFDIHFELAHSKNKTLESATYAFKSCNRSSEIFKELESSIKLIFEHPDTREKRSVEIFTSPKKDMLPSDHPIYIIPNPQLTDTICDNITEYKKTLDEKFKPKHFLVRLAWVVKISEDEFLEVKKTKYVLMEHLL